MNRLAIMVINWNNSDDSIECLSSLLKQTTRDITLLSIDNDSSDDSVSILSDFVTTHSDRDIRLIRHDKNDGTSGGFNVGIKWAMENNYDFVGTLNADAVADKNWVKSLLGELKSHPTTGIATGILARRDGKTLDTTGDFYTTWGIPGPRLRDAPFNKAPSKPGYVFGSTGGGFIARVSMLKQIGLFDERFFMYYEDVDLCFRAQLAGWKVRYTPKAIAYHKLGASSATVPGLAVYNTFKNLPILYIKNVPRGLMWHIGVRFSLTYILILGNAIKNGSGVHALKGWIKSIYHIPHALRERRRIQSEKQVSVAYISSIIMHDIPPEQTGMRKFRKFFTGR